MKTLSRFLNRFANRKSLLVFILLYIVFPGYILKNAEETINKLAGKEIGVIDLKPGFDTDRTRQMLTGYGEEARAYYSKIESTADILYPVIYAFLFAIILSLLFRNTRWHLVNILPFITMIFDFCENIFILKLLNDFPVVDENLLIGCETCKLLKWICFGLISMLLLGGLVALLFKRRTQAV